MNPDVKASSLPSLLIGSMDDPLSFIDLLSDFCELLLTFETKTRHEKGTVFILIMLFGLIKLMD